MSRNLSGRGTLSPRALTWALCGFLAVGTVVMAGSKGKRVLSKTKFDPSAERIELFDGLDEEVLTARVLAKNEFGGQVFIENTTDKPLTVELPESIVAVQVLPQGFGGAGGGDADGGGTSGGGGGQAAGGGLGGGGLGGGGFGGGGLGGGGFFSIPAGATVRVPYHSVCLEHGKREPHPRMNYKLVRPEEFTQNAEVHELLKLIASRKLNKQAAQAAAWHLASGMSWQDLMAKKYDRVGVPDTPYFSRLQLAGAQEIVAHARLKASEQKEDAPQAPVARDRVGRPVAAQ